MTRKTFYTERDIEDMLNNGQTTLTITPNVALTDLARERAEQVGLTLLDGDTAVSPAAILSPQPTQQADLVAKIKASVIAKLGQEAPEALLDAIIPQILAKLK